MTLNALTNSHDNSVAITATCVRLLATLPRAAQRRWLQRAFFDGSQREAALTAADLLAFPHPNDAPSLRNCVVESSETLLAPHQRSLRRAVGWHRWRFIVLALQVSLVAFVAGAVVWMEIGIVTSSRERNSDHNTNRIVGPPPTAAAVDTESASTPRAHAGNALATSPLSIASREWRTRLVAMTKDALLTSLGKRRDDLTASEQRARDTLAAALDAAQLSDAASAVRRNHLGVALGLQSESLRAAGIDPRLIEPESIQTEVTIAQRSEEGGTEPLATTTDGLPSRRAFGGTQDGATPEQTVSRGEASRAKPDGVWGELPSPPQSRSWRDELIFLSPEDRRAAERYLLLIAPHNP